MEKSLEAYLTEAYKQFIYIKIFEYQKSKKVFDVVFDKVKKAMDENSTYFKENAKQVMTAGSVRNRVKISKLDEFDLDIVVRLPVAARALAVQPGEPAFVSLQVGQEFEDLKKHKKFPDSYKVLHEWRDHDNYILQDKFRQWLHGIVDKALNTLNNQVIVDDKKYSVTYTVSGPAYTLKIHAEPGSPEFHLDVDLVPVFRFQHPKWPGEDYRNLPESITRYMKDWLAVPKPNKDFTCDTKRSRHWRLSFQEFEVFMMKDCQRLKPTFRLLKKLRDSLELKEIASYYINTLFLWKIDKEESDFWHKSLSELFCIMVEDFYSAIKAKTILYFWNDNNNSSYNLIGHIPDSVLQEYEGKLQVVHGYILAKDVDKIISCLLTKTELEKFVNPQIMGLMKSSMLEDIDSHVTSTASTSNNPQFMGFMESSMLEEIDSNVTSTASTSNSSTASVRVDTIEEDIDRIIEENMILEQIASAEKLAREELASTDVENDQEPPEEWENDEKISWTRRLKRLILPSLLFGAAFFSGYSARGPDTVRVYDGPTGHEYGNADAINLYQRDNDTITTKKAQSTAIQIANEPSPGCSGSQVTTIKANNDEDSSHQSRYKSRETREYIYHTRWMFCADVVELNHFEEEFEW